MSTESQYSHRAAYGPDIRDPYCASSDSGHAEACRQDATDDAPSVKELLSAVEDAAQQKKQEWLTLADVVAAQTQVVKKSILVTVLATLAAFTFCCCAWLALNAALVIGLNQTGAPLILTIGLSAGINLILAYGGFRIAKSAYEHISFMDILRVVTPGTEPTSGEQDDSVS